jgi:serine/threonine-protein kinase
MHQHLRSPLVPPDHINTQLSSGIGEIVEVAMAKRREDRYASTEDMLEDLRLVRDGHSPRHAHRAVNLDALSQIEETGTAVERPPARSRWADLMANPLAVVLLSLAGVSLLFNLILLMVMSRR